MRKMVYIRNSIIIILCVTIVCMAFGFILLSIEMKKEKDKVASYNVLFAQVEKASSVKGSNSEPYSKADIIKGGLVLDLQFLLYAPRDEVTFIARIENRGSMAAEIVDLLEIPNYSEEKNKEMISPVTITLSDIEGKIVPPGEDTTLKIVVYYPPGTSESKKVAFRYQIALLTKSR